MTTITINLHQASGCLPDADTDVLVLAEGDTEMQLGPLIGNEPPAWVDAQGESLRVVAWAEMPRLPKLAAESITLKNGHRLNLAEPWRVPA